MALRLILDEKIPILPPKKAPWIRIRIRLKMRIRIQGTQKGGSMRIRIRILSPGTNLFSVTQKRAFLINIK